MESNEILIDKSTTTSNDNVNDNGDNCSMTITTPITLPIIDPTHYKSSEIYLDDRLEFQQYWEENQNSSIAILEYLEKFSKTNLNKFIHSILYIIEWSCMHQKQNLPLYLANIDDYQKTRLKLPNFNDDSDNEKIFTEIYCKHFQQLLYEFFDVYFRYHRYMTSINDLLSIFPQLKWLMLQQSNNVGHYLCQLMARTQQSDTIGFIFDMIFTDLDFSHNNNDDDKSIQLDALIIVFIKVMLLID